MESLRIEPPVIYSTLLMFTETIEIGGYTIKAGDPFMIDMLFL
jgi:cytochrome P450